MTPQKKHFRNMNAADDTKILTKVAVTYHPPTFKFEYTRSGSLTKYHKRINLANSEWRIASTEEFSREITKALVERYTELIQIPSKKIERLISKLLSRNPNLHLEKSVDAPMQVNMSISKGSLLVTPLRERPKLQRMNSCDVADNEATSRLQLHSASQLVATVSSKEKERLKAFGDLNKVSEQELIAAKDEMTKVYEKSIVMPGDDEYIYDKRVDFHGPDEESSWD